MSYFRFSVGCGEEWTRTTELRRGQIYSLLQLPLCDFPISMPSIVWELEPMKGLEPPTGWLQISYSTNWVTSAFSACQTTLFLVIWGCKNTTFFKHTKIFFIFFAHFHHNKLVYNIINCQKKCATPSLPHCKTHIFTSQSTIFPIPTAQKKYSTFTII